MSNRVESIIRESCIKYEVPKDIIADVVKKGRHLFTADSVGPALPTSNNSFKTISEYVLQYKEDTPSQETKKDKVLKELNRHAKSGDMRSFRKARRIFSSL